VNIVSTKKLCELLCKLYIANMDEAIFRQIHELKNNKNENEED
jgi:hypothetical protein